MPKKSAGLLLYRENHGDGAIEVLIGHMGGPFWAKKDDAAWSIPKGEFEQGEEPFDVARREFEEELGSPPPEAEYEWLGSFRQPNGKEVSVWTASSDFDASDTSGNMVPVEWPPRSGKIIEVPEIDRAAWVEIDTARRRVVRGQVPMLDALEKRLGETSVPW
jgi:predicted NUDIX family NTP pyrophosphohydrolase